MLRGLDRLHLILILLRIMFSPNFIRILCSHLLRVEPFPRNIKMYFQLCFDEIKNLTDQTLHATKIRLRVKPLLIADELKCLAKLQCNSVLDIADQTPTQRVPT